jgi:hypothetical protein
MQDMPGAQDPRGFVVEWQLADDAVTGVTPGVIDVIDLIDRSDSEVVLTDDVGISTSSGG